MKQDYFKVITYEEALYALRNALPVRRTEQLKLAECHGRTLAADVYSPESLPSFNRSSVDGYALKARDSYGASESLPAILDYAGEILMGQASGLEPAAGQCAWIPTGGMLPAACDAVIMVEYTEKLDERTILLHRPVSPGENVMIAGEDVEREQLLFATGHIIRAVDIGLMAALGITQLDVISPFRFGIISSGDEVVNVEATPGPGQVRDVNGLALRAALETLGQEVASVQRVVDDASLLEAAVNMALKDCDLVFLSGGSSVGVKDMSLQVLLSLPGAELLFHGLAVKPGKPTLAVRCREGLVIGLPGHPVSALMIFYILCKPVLTRTNSNSVQGVLSENYASQAGRDDFVPVKLLKDGGNVTVKPLLGKSGLISILALADGYMHIPRKEQGLPKGTCVKVVMF